MKKGIGLRKLRSNGSRMLRKLICRMRSREMPVNQATNEAKIMSSERADIAAENYVNNRTA